MFSIKMCAVVLASASMFGQTTTAPTTRTLHFPPIGIGTGESVEINVTNVASNSSTGTAASCTGTFSFLNAAGTATGATTNFTVTSGQSSSARLPFASSGITSNRGVVRGVVTLNVPSTTPRPPCSLAITLEIFDTTSGATHILLTGDGLGYGGDRH